MRLLVKEDPEEIKKIESCFVSLSDRFFNTRIAVGVATPRLFFNWSEFIVETSLEILVRSGIVSSFFHAPKNSPLDHAGIDFQVFYSNKKISLQVKGSREGVRKHLLHHPDIPYILVSRTEMGRGRAKDQIERVSRAMYLTTAKEILKTLREYIFLHP